MQSSVTLPGLAVPIGVHGCLATRRCTELFLPGSLRTGRSGGTRVLPLVASPEPRIHNNMQDVCQPITQELRDVQR